MTKNHCILIRLFYSVDVQPLHKESVRAWNCILNGKCMFPPSLFKDDFMRKSVKSE